MTVIWQLQIFKVNPKNISGLVTDNYVKVYGCRENLQILYKKVPLFIYTCFFSYFTAILDYCDMADGWKYINNRCLKHFDDPLPWFDARRECQKHQGDLMIFKDWNENRELDSIIECKTQDQKIWIGLSDTVSDEILHMICPFCSIFHHPIIILPT